MLFDVIGRPNSQYACELFLVIGISLAEKDQQRGFTLLHTALYKGADFTTLTYLAGHVASLLLKRSKDGSFTVHSASVSAEPETFKWLLDNRITPLNVFNGQQWTPLHLAVTPITSEYDDEDDKMRYVQRLKLLLQYGAKINLPGSGNQTALDRVLSEGDKALLMLMFLLQKVLMPIM
ncbi:MAG: hypothetical protein HWD59_07485 [Coxiellaceae bacterium]|nr:MAG: hypothetical protein HWD59_07485 [Coxiellaceae bacterium]